MNMASHPPNIEPEPPNMIHDILPELLKNKTMFNQNKEPYEKICKSNGFNNTLEYPKQNDDTASTKGRKKTSDLLQCPLQLNIKDLQW